MEFKPLAISVLIEITVNVSSTSDVISVKRSAEFEIKNIGVLVKNNVFKVSFI